MTCTEVRTALSARLDAEDPGVPDQLLDSHAVGCAGCRDWLARAVRVGDALRREAPTVPDLTPAVLAAVADEPRPAATGAAVWSLPAVAQGRRQVLRVAVAAAAAAQFAAALPVLLAGFGIAVGSHASREMASFEVALAVGFALAAYRPERARVFVPVAFVLAVLLAGTSVLDVANATTTLTHEIGHLVAVAQAGLLWALGRTAPAAGPPLPNAMAAARG